MKHTLKKNHTYKARLGLSFMESFADNGLIADKFILLGFVDVEVSGSGFWRIAEGTWIGEEVTVDLPPQVDKVIEV